MSFGMDMVGRGVQQGGTDIQTMGLGLKAYSSYLQMRQKGRALKLQAELADWRAGQYGRQADDLFAQAGDYQEQGQKEAQIRTLQLGRDVGRIYSGAAGAGIDASSRIAVAAERAARSEAARDVGEIAADAAGRARTSIAQSVTARQDAVFARADAKQLRANAKWAKNAGYLQLAGGMLSALGFHMGQTAQNWSPGS